MTQLNRFIVFIEYKKGSFKNGFESKKVME